MKKYLVTSLMVLGFLLVVPAGVALANKDVSIDFSGIGNGTVINTQPTPSGNKFNCVSTAGTESGTCNSVAFGNNDQITLSASPLAGSAIGGWSVGPYAINAGCGITDLTCQFTMNNTAQTIVVTLVPTTAHIIVKKNAVPDNAQDFTFTNNFGNSNPASFALDDDAQVTLLDTRNSEVLPGTYAVSETLPFGWKQFSATCDQGETIDSIDVAAGETVTCTFVNHKLGSITIIKNTVGGNGTFDFTTTGGNNLPASPQIITSSNTGNVTYTDIDPDISFSITETAKAGWDQTSVACQSETGANKNVASFQVNNGGSVTCTFINTELPKLTVTKIVINDNGGAKVISDFPFKIDSTIVTSGVQNISTIGAHTVSETNNAGYTSTISGDCATDGTITFIAGDVKNCTITNDDIAPTITLNKVVTNDNGGNAGVNDFSLSIGGTFVNSGQVLPVSANIPIELVELSLTGYSFISITGDAGCPSEIGGTVTLTEGENLTCTITNNDQPGTLIVKKVMAGDSQISPSIFQIHVKKSSEDISGSPQAGQSGDGTTYNNLSIGSYVISEENEGNNGYFTSFSGDCDTHGVVNVVSGETVECVVTNNVLNHSGGNSGLVGQNNSSPAGQVLGASIENNNKTEGTPQSIGEVLGAEKFIFTQYMKLGSKYGEVSELQKRLIAEGYYGGMIDGKFGKLLQKAVKDYQTTHPPLKVDGIVGPKTRAVLNS